MYRLYLHCSQYIHTLYLVYFPFPFCLSFLPLRSSLLFLHLRFLPSCRIIPIVFPLKSYNPLSTRINLTSIEINKSYIFFCFYLDASSYNYVNISVNFFVLNQSKPRLLRLIGPINFSIFDFLSIRASKEIKVPKNRSMRREKNVMATKEETRKRKKS